MASLLLTHGYFLWEDEKEQQIMRPYPPLGLLYVSAYLKRLGFDVDVFDTTLQSRDALLQRLDLDRGVLGVYTNLMTRASVLAIASAAKARGWIVVLGGPESANYPEEYLSTGADVIVIGEGEETMAELLPALEANGPHRLEGIAGTVFRDESGTIRHNPPRAQIPSLDTLPWPDRLSVDIPAYVDIWRRHHGRGSVTMTTARGCPYKCNWCSHAVFGFSHRRRPVLDCANELEWLRDTYKPDQVWYADDVFTIHHRWMFDYARELERRGIRLPFETISRADRMMKEEVLETLARMGCYRIWIGAESGSQRILDAMQRGVTREQVEWASHAAARHGIEVGMFLMWGYEGETVDDISQTVDLVKRAAPTIFLTTVAYPIKNTGYFHKVAGKTRLDLDWASASDRDYQIEGRAGRSYYRHADDWLRHEVALGRLDPGDPAGHALRTAADQARAALVAGASS